MNEINEMQISVASLSFCIEFPWSFLTVNPNPNLNLFSWLTHNPNKYSVQDKGLFYQTHASVAQKKIMFNPNLWKALAVIQSVLWLHIWYT